MENEKLTAADMADIIYQASSLYLASNIPVDYGTGEIYTMAEVHMLKYIIENPDQTVTDLSLNWDKSKAAISQMLKKLETKGLITRGPVPDSNKKQWYYATKKGLELNDSHFRYDTEVFGTTLEYLREACPEEDIQLCFRVLKEFCKARRRKHYCSKDDKMIENG